MTLEQQIAEAERELSAANQAVNITMANAEEKRAKLFSLREQQKQQPRGPFGLPVSPPGVVSFVPWFYFNRTLSGAWTAGQGSLHNQPTAGLEQELIKLRDALCAATKTTPVDTAEIESLRKLGAAAIGFFEHHGWRHWQTAPGLALCDLAMAEKKRREGT